MSPIEISRRFVFYHADRYASLKEDQLLELDEHNLSRFGKTYWPIISQNSFDELSDAAQREFLLEEIRRNQPRYSPYTSRLQSIFAANTVAEAIVFAQSIIPQPTAPIPIIEIYADRFWTLDSNWLDFEDPSRRTERYAKYWEGLISNHRPATGERRAPRLEVMIALPAITGKIVHVVDPLSQEGS
jgi:hypothetical protein